MAEVTNPPAKSEGRAMMHSTPRSFTSLRREMDRMFEDLENGSWLTPFRRLFDTESRLAPFDLAPSPAVDICELQDAYEVKADVPGMDEKSLKVSVANGALTLRGETHENKEEKHRNYFLNERRYGEFERRFMLPPSVDAEKIEAHFKQGVLTVRLPKKAEAIVPEKKIEIKSTN